MYSTSAGLVSRGLSPVSRVVQVQRDLILHGIYVGEEVEGGTWEAQDGEVETVHIHLLAKFEGWINE